MFDGLRCGEQPRITCLAGLAMSDDWVDRK
jgi:hypothetical protein